MPYRVKKPFERFEFFPTFRSRLTVNHFETCTAYSPETLWPIQTKTKPKGVLLINF